MTYFRGRLFGSAKSDDLESEVKELREKVRKLSEKVDDLKRCSGKASIYETDIPMSVYKEFFMSRFESTELSVWQAIHLLKDHLGLRFTRRAGTPETVVLTKVTPGVKSRKKGAA